MASSNELRGQLLGLTGSVASGKDTAAEYLVSAHGFFHVSTSDIVRSEAMKRHGSVDRNILHDVANDIRLREGIGALCVRSLDVFLGTAENPDIQGLVISGIRALGEGREVKDMGGGVVFVDADPSVRYQRLLSRSKPGEITRTFEEFVAFDLSEETGDNDYSQNIQAVKSIADHIVDNGADQSNLYKQLDRILQ